jgi:hypothetical protein
MSEYWIESTNKNGCLVKHLTLSSRMTKTMNQPERAKKMYKIIAKAWADEAFKRDVKSLDRQKKEHPPRTPIH